jgi:hypothetical protein
MSNKSKHYYTSQLTGFRARAKRLGYRLRKRGSRYELRASDRAGFSVDIDGLFWWLHVIENNITAEISTTWTGPLFKINAASEWPSTLESEPEHT